MKEITRNDSKIDSTTMTLIDMTLIDVALLFEMAVFDMRRFKINKLVHKKIDYTTDSSTIAKLIILL